MENTEMKTEKDIIWTTLPLESTEESTDGGIDWKITHEKIKNEVELVVSEIIAIIVETAKKESELVAQDNAVNEEIINETPIIVLNPELAKAA